MGVTFCDNLKWNSNTQEIINKASKRLYLIRVHKRAGVPPLHLVTIYNALVRSVLEYACPVWSNSPQQYLNQKVEKVQKRAMRIIHPYISYDMALSLSSIPRLEERRLSICSRTFTNACDPTSRLFSNVWCVATRCTAIIYVTPITSLCPFAEQSVLKIVSFQRWLFSKP